MDEATTGPEFTRDALLGGHVSLLQPRRGHRAGTDAVLLAGLAPVRAGDRVADLGSASGAVGLVLAGRASGLHIAFVERDAGLAELCRRNIAANGLEGRAEVIHADLFAPRAERAAVGLAGHDMDLVVTNPPFFEPGERPSPDPARRAAHALNGGGLDTWIRAAADCLKARGRLALIHRADRLDLCLAALRPAFGSVVLRPVHPRAEAPASRILLSARRGGRAPLRIEPALVLHDGLGFTPEAGRLHGPRPCSRFAES